MTNPTLTYGRAWAHDLNDTTGWSLTDSGLGATLSASNSVFNLEGTCDNVADEYSYYALTLPSTFSSDVFPKITCKWCTSVAPGSDGLQAKLLLGFTVGSQWITLGKSTGWTVTESTITAGKTVNAIAVVADDDPDSVDAGTFNVFFDFIIAHVGTHTFPFVSDNINIHIPNKIVVLPIPGCNVNKTQHMGRGNAIITLQGDMNENANWGSPDGEYLYRSLCDDYRVGGFHYFTSDKGNFKVNVLDFDNGQRAGSQGPWRLRLQEYSDGSMSDSYWHSKQWFGF